MNDSVVMNLCHQAFMTALLTSGPIMLAVLVIGVVVSLLQAITQVQEATLTFVPKLLGAGIVMLVGGHWMLDQIVRFTGELFGQLARYAH